MRVGLPWEDGIYAGITHDNQHLICGWQSHSDYDFGEAVKFPRPPWRLPTKKEAALLYANLQHLFNPVWYWTSEEYPPDNTCMWVQTFGYGRQADLRKTDGARVCIVKTIPCE